MVSLDMIACCAGDGGLGGMAGGAVEGGTTHAPAYRTDVIGRDRSLFLFFVWIDLFRPLSFQLVGQSCGGRVEVLVGSRTPFELTKMRRSTVG